jgi:transcriptional regulator with XRE-family HTH domain
MTASATELILELKTLRKGQGLAGEDIAGRIGPHLRQICSIDVNAPSTEVRNKIASWLEKQTESLSADQRIAILAAFAIEPIHQSQWYKDRLDWAAEKLERDPRSVRRKIDYAIDLIAARAQSLTSRAMEPNWLRPAWHTEALRVWHVLDGPHPEAVEFRRIVAEQDDLDELDLALSVPRESDDRASVSDLLINVFHGGTLRESKLESSTRVGLFLQLPAPLDAGQSHEFMIRYRIESDRKTEPHYVCTPRHRCDMFDLRVRFGSEKVPRSVQRFSELFQRDITDPNVATESVRVNSAGEVQATFHQLTLGMAYGLRWQY